AIATISARPMTTPTATLIIGFPRAEADRSALNNPLTATGAGDAGCGSPPSTAAESAATRASERRRSSRSRCQANPPHASAANIETIISTNRTESTRVPPDHRNTNSTATSTSTSTGDPSSRAGPNRPLPPGVHGALLEPRAKPLQHADAAHAAIAADDDFQQALAGDAAAARLLRVVRLHLLQQPRRLDAAAGPVRPAADAAA